MDNSESKEMDSPTETSDTTWIDILSYPLNVSGIIHLVIFFFWALLFRPAINRGFWLSPSIWRLAALVILTGYFLYYLAACIRGSIAGEQHAPDINLQPNQLKTDAILSRLFSTFIWAVVCFGPLIVYYITTRRADSIFWLLVIYGIFYSIMSFMAIVMFDTLWALNPILIFGSIFSVFIPYMALVSAFCLLWGLIILLWYWSAIAGGGGVYIIIVMAHLLGRFYLRHEHRLRWEV